MLIGNHQTLVVVPPTYLDDSDSDSLQALPHGLCWAELLLTCGMVQVWSV